MLDMNPAEQMAEFVTNVTSEDTKALSVTTDVYPAETENLLNKPDLLQCSNVVRTDFITHLGTMTYSMSGRWARRETRRGEYFHELTDLTWN